MLALDDLVANEGEIVAHEDRAAEADAGRVSVAGVLALEAQDPRELHAA